MKYFRIIIMLIFALSLPGCYTCGETEYYGPLPDNPDDMHEVRYYISSDVNSVDISVFITGIDGNIGVRHISFIPIEINILSCGDEIPYCGMTEHFPCDDLEMTVYNNGPSISNVNIIIIVDYEHMASGYVSDLALDGSVYITTEVDPDRCSVSL